MFGLTRQEEQVVLFLISVALVGLGVNFAIKINAKVEKLVKVDEDEMIMRIDINSAEFEDLIRVKGIGPGLAKNIIAYRNTYGPFGGLEELKKIKGIGKVRYERIKDYLILSP